MRVLAVGAHPDDIELGCAGALLHHVAAGDEVTLLVLTPGDAGPQGVLSRVREQEVAARVLGAELIWGDFHDGEIPDGRDTVAYVDAVVRRTGAEIVYVHAPNDTHQDHMAASRAVLAAARRLTRVLYYQSPSTTSFDPNVFVDVESTLAGKLEAIKAHWSQVMQCPMVDTEAIEVSARYWGTRAKICYAEAFETPRFVWDVARRRPALALVSDESEHLAPVVTLGPA